MKRYRTLKQLQHGTTLHPPGAIVELEDIDAQWCVGMGVIDPEPVSADAVPEGRSMPPPLPAAPARKGCSGCGWK